MDGLMEWSRNIVCFSIFAALIKNLLPGEKYAPYVRLYTGFMLLLVFLTPVLKALDADATLNYLTGLLGGTLEIREDSFLASLNENSNYESQKKEYTKRLEESVVAYLTGSLGTQSEYQEYIVERAEVEWEETEDSDAFGIMTGVVVYLKKAEEEETEKAAGGIGIDAITIEVFSGLKGDKQEEEGEESRQIKRLLSGFYNLKEEDIAVRITG